MIIGAFLADNASVAMVEVIFIQGSTPREAGAFMLVSEVAQWGTIGGGRLEFDALKTARSILGQGVSTEVDVSLGPEIGQCCGGRVRLRVSDMNNAQKGDLLRYARGRTPQVFVFGAGHVGAALAKVLAPLPVSVRLVDERAEMSAEVVIPPEAAVAQASPGDGYVVVTHEHATDFLIVEEVLKRGDAAYIGMIGSKTKRAVLEKQIRQAGLDPSPVVCPIGASGLGDKRPEVIAVCVAAEILVALGAR